MKGPSVASGGSLEAVVFMAWKEVGQSARRASARRNAVSSEEPEAYFAPQHRSVPVFTSLLSTPGRGLAEISVTPVSV